mmetsp:Transcript_132977/g.344066  ORF Transcript_132977/g.344066 Transcript_132977/m.344066 type:complete len:297 (-) Transcript_132977:488-1378(-)
MELCLEATLVRAGCPALLELGGDSGSEQLLGLDLRDLNVAVRIPVQQQLGTDEIWQVLEALGVLRGERLQDRLLSGLDARRCELVVQLGHQALELGDELDEALREHNDPVVLPRLAPLLDHVREVHGQVSQALLIAGHLLAEQASIRARKERDLKGDVRRRAAHQAHDVVVLLCAERIDSDVAHQGGVSLASRIEAEGDRDVRRALEVAVNRLRCPDDLGLATVLFEVLRQDSPVGVGVVAADDHQSVKTDGVAHCHRVLELLVGLNLVSAAAEHVETPSVAEAVHDLAGDLHKVA